MYFKNRILFIPMDKIIIKPRMVSNNVIQIHYNYTTDTYSTLKAKFSKVVNKHKDKIVNIDSIGILTTSSTNGISFTAEGMLDVKTKYNTTDVAIVQFESLVHFMYSAILLISDKKQLIQLDLIASNVVTDKSNDLLKMISDKTGMIINTSRGEIYNYNCVLDYSTRYADAHCNRSMIGRYFTCKIKMLSSSLSIVKIESPEVPNNSLFDTIVNIFNSALSTIGNLLNPLKILEICISAISVVADLFKKAYTFVTTGTIRGTLQKGMSDVADNDNISQLLDVLVMLISMVNPNNIYTIIDLIQSATKLSPKELSSGELTRQIASSQPNGSSAYSVAPVVTTLGNKATPVNQSMFELITNVSKLIGVVNKIITNFTFDQVVSGIVDIGKFSIEIIVKFVMVIINAIKQLFDTVTGIPNTIASNISLITNMVELNILKADTDTCLTNAKKTLEEVNNAGDAQYIKVAFANMQETIIPTRKTILDLYYEYTNKIIQDGKKDLNYVDILRVVDLLKTSLTTAEAWANGCLATSSSSTGTTTIEPQLKQVYTTLIDKSTKAKKELEEVVIPKLNKTIALQATNTQLLTTNSYT